jgi:hypothetical protein
MSLAEHIGTFATHQASEAASTTVGRVVDAIRPIEIPGVGELLALLNAKQIGAQGLSGALRQHGVYLPHPAVPNSLLTDNEANVYGKLWQKMVYLSMPRPSEEQLLVMLNRNPKLNLKVLESFRSKGWDADGWMDAWLDLAKEIPGSADLVRFAVRHVFEPDLVTAFGYNDELNPQFEFWHAKQGFGYDLPPLTNNGVTIEKWNWAQAFWWSHWVLPSPGQGYTMLQRLRPTGGEGGGPRVPGVLPFDLDDLRLLLRANDYPPYWRDRLAAISYHPIGIRILRQLVTAKLISQAECYEIFQDQGYTPANADLQAKLLFSQAGAEKATHPARKLAAAARKAYDLGIISSQDFYTTTYRSQLNTVADVAAFDALSPDQQQAKAVADQPTFFAFQEATLEASVGDARRIVNSVRSKYLKGIINEGGVRGRLNNAGFTAEAIQRYLTSWGLEFDQQRREMSTRQIQNYLRWGIMAADEGSRRLQNLGWNNADISYLLTEVQRDVGIDVARAQAKAAATAKAQIRAQQELLRQIRQQQHQAWQDLARHGSPGQLKDWAVRNIISLPIYFQRMQALGWPAADINSMVAEIQQIQAFALAQTLKRLAKKPPAGPKRIPVGTLGKWLKRGEITQADFRGRLLAQGYALVDVDNYVTQYS